MDKQHQEKCSKCGGNGIQFTADAYTYFKDWRKRLGLSQAQVCLGISLPDISQLSKFENGLVVFGESRLRDLEAFYTKQGKRIERSLAKEKPNAKP